MEMQKQSCTTQNTNQSWQQKTIVEIDKQELTSLTEYICSPEGHCRYPLLALRLLIYVISQIDSQGKMNISARKLAHKMDVHYDSLNKTILYLRKIGVLHVEYKTHN